MIRQVLHASAGWPDSGAEHRNRVTSYRQQARCYRIKVSGRVMRALDHARFNVKDLGYPGSDLAGRLYKETGNPQPNFLPIKMLI